MDLMTRIKEEIRIEDYVAACGFHLERHGATHLRLKEHSSFIIDPQKNRFWWNSRCEKGSVIDLVMLMEGKSQEEAIRKLAKQLGGVVAPSRKRIPCVQAAAPHTKTLVLPPECKKHWRRVYAYLLNTRQITRGVFDWLAEGGYIYPDDKGNLVYIAKGVDGQPTYAAIKGTVQSKRYMHVITGSDYEARAAWNLAPSNKAWLVCEAAVDAWSLMSLFELRGTSAWQDYGFISLECCYPGPLREHLARIPHPPTIYLAQDADDAGDKSRASTRRLLQDLGYTGNIIDKRPPQGKDWNDYLKYKKGGSAYD